MNRVLCATLAMSVSVGLSNAEVITGNGYPQDYLDFPESTPSGGFIEELGLYFHGYNEFAGSGFTNYLLTGATDSPERTLRFLQSSNTSGIFTRSYYTEGQSLINDMGVDSPTPETLLALENSGFFDYAGADGETLYIGFIVEVDDGSTTQTNYGFLQLLHESELNYRVMGWAYETQAGTDLVTFNVPAPSGLALVAAGGLIAMRRRRG
jgi:hypothetical protein